MPVQLQAFQTDQPTNPFHKVVTEPQDFEAMVRRVQDSRTITFDFETSGTAWFQHAEACGLALAVADDQNRITAYYTPFRHKSGEKQLAYEVVAPAFKQILENPNTLKIAHNIKFDAHIARREGWMVQGPRYDTMVAARLYNENERIGLKTRAKTDLGHLEVDSWERLLNREIAKIVKASKKGVTKYKHLFGFSEIPINLCGTYACWDAHYTTELYWHYEKWGLSGRYSRIWPTEMALTEVLGDMEWEGLPLDVEYLENLRITLGEAKEDLETKILEVNGGFKFNIGSDLEVRSYLRDHLMLPLQRMTKGGNLSVDHDVLEEFSGHHPAIPLLMEWRDCEKIISTYTSSLLELVDSKNVLHPSFNSVGTNSGRISCREPNFQNQASDDDNRAKMFSGMSLEDGGVDPWSIKRAFVVRSKQTPRLMMDYNQAELRVLTAYSKDEVMTDAYLKGEDIHSRTSMEVFGTAEKSKRRLAKVIGFGLSFVMSEIGFARQAKIPVEDAKAYLDKFFERYSGIARFREDLWNRMIANNCEIDNLFGRTRRLPDLKADEFWKRKRAQRQAIGSLIQGTAAELTKESMVRIYQFLKSEHPDAKMVNTVHDEIQIDCPVDCLTPVVKNVTRMMEDFPEFAPIPIIVDGEYSTTNWAEKKPLPR